MYYWSQKGFVSYPYGIVSASVMWQSACVICQTYQALVSNIENNMMNDANGVGSNEKNLILWSAGIIFSF